MSSPEQKPNFNREEILNNCLLLRTFIDTTRPYGGWEQDIEFLDEQFGKVIEGICKEKEWEWKILGAAISVGEQFSIYHEDACSKRIMWAAKNLFLIGYRVGDIEKVSAFMPDILGKLNWFGIFNKKQKKDVILNYNLGIVNAGIRAKEFYLHEQEIKHDEKEPTPKVFREFINSLNFGDFED